MNAAFEISKEIPFFKRWWIKRHLLKYVNVAAKHLAALRDEAWRAQLAINWSGGYIRYDVNIDSPELSQYKNKIEDFQKEYERNIEFIKNPPVEFPMTPFQVSLALDWNKKNIEQLTDKVEGSVWWMFNEEGKIVNLHMSNPGMDCLVAEMNEEMAVYVHRRATLSLILKHEAPRKFPGYKKAVKQLIKEIK